MILFLVTSKNYVMIKKRGTQVNISMTGKTSKEVDGEWMDEQYYCSGSRQRRWRKLPNREQSKYRDDSRVLH